MCEPTAGCLDMGHSQGSSEDLVGEIYFSSFLPLVLSTLITLSDKCEGGLNAPRLGPLERLGFGLSRLEIQPPLLSDPILCGSLPEEVCRCLAGGFSSVQITCAAPHSYLIFIQPLSLDYFVILILFSQ